MSQNDESEIDTKDEDLMSDDPEQLLVVNLEMDMQTRKLSIRNIEKPLADFNENRFENKSRLSLNKTNEISLDNLEKS